MMNRRTLLATIPSLAAWSAFAEDAPSALQTYERESGGRIGLYAENLATGTKIAWRADERRVMCSTFKASLAALVLARVDRGEDRLDDIISYSAADLLDYAPVARENLAKGAISVDEMCKAMVEFSDNTFANLLLARVGGPAALTGFWRATGDSISRLDHNEPELNFPPPGDPSNSTTPIAMAGTLRRVVLGEVLTPASRDRLIGWMVNCKTGANRLRAGLPTDWKIADKTGNNGVDAAGDIAVAWPRANAAVVICAYTQGGTPTKAQLETVFAAIGRMVGEQLG
uniref:beta-lactamase n=1 Tax=Rhodopseudomonas palustris (strain BisA53) TaxID=316055 RepID=Q07QH1_RHOP5